VLAASARDLTIVIDGHGRCAPTQVTVEALRDTVRDGADVMVVDAGGAVAAVRAAVDVSRRPLLLLLRGGVRPAGDLVRRHLDQHRGSPRGRLVLGAAPWPGATRFHTWNISGPTAALGEAATVVALDGGDASRLEIELRATGLEFLAEPRARVRCPTRLDVEAIRDYGRSVAETGVRWHAPDSLPAPAADGLAAFVDGWSDVFDLAQLRAYLGSGFDEADLLDHRGAVEREEATAENELAFYRSSRAYLYDLTAFGSWPTKRPYRAVLRQFTPPGGRLLDYGCGVGADGVRLLRLGYRVEFADFDNPSTAFLRWRLADSGLTAPIHDIEGIVPGGFDTAYAFDVIEHVADPFAFLARLEALARLVVVNLLEPEPADTHLHRALPIERLVDRARRHGLLYYRRFHGRSHLLVYRGRPTRNPLRRLVSARTIDVETGPGGDPVDRRSG